jgi:HAD superfamily hydrolase (TIGR01509 family)
VRLESPTVIRNVVFDIGWVFVHLNAAPLLKLLTEHEVDTSDLDALVARIALADHECGRIDGAALMARLQALTARPIAANHLEAGWLDMFELQQPMVDLARRLTDTHRVYLLSNVGDLHWGHLSRTYGFDRLGHGVLTSYSVGVMKPDARIYEEAERRFGLEPAATVFIDDRADNIATARGRGWHGIVHAGHATTLAELGRLGVVG